MATTKFLSLMAGKGARSIYRKLAALSLMVVTSATGGGLGGFVETAAAQAAGARILVDGQTVERVASDSVKVLRDRTVERLDSLRAAGHLMARLDTMNTEGDAPVARITSGPRAQIGAVEWVGIDAARAEELRRRAGTGAGEVFTPQKLEEIIARILSFYADEARYLASVSVERIEPYGDEGLQLAVRLHVEEGPRVRLKRIDLIGGSRTSPELAMRLTGLDVGEPLVGFNPQSVRQSLMDAGYFVEIGEPEIVIESDSGAVVKVPVDEGDPGSFDLVLGYLPPRVQGERGRIIGNGHLQLRNLFGGGRALAVRLHRLPDQASSIDAMLSSPFVFGLPVGLAGRFHGLEQDSTYGKQDYGGEIRFHAASGVDILGSFSREVTSPGQAGLRLGEAGRQVVPKSDAWFLGLGASVRRLDRSTNPTRGLLVEMNLESGRKERAERLVVEGDTTRRSTVLDQKRLRSSARLYLPVFGRQVVVLGGDGGLLISSEYDRSDLFRFGGATSLRGYDEDRFLGRAVARGLLEYRILLDRLSYAYAFVDVGYVDRPATPDLESSSGFHPGYGLGIQFESAVGLINVSAALNPEGSATDARIHAGLSFGL